MELWQSFKLKSRENAEAAKMLASRWPNAAANRIYYALYQAIVSELISKGVKPAEIDFNTAKALSDDPAKWKHSFILNNSSLAGLDRHERKNLAKAWILRRKSDYEEEAVGHDEIQMLLKELPDMLESLGI